jgi:Ca-activated chloride channel homolog
MKLLVNKKENMFYKSGYPLILMMFLLSFVSFAQREKKFIKEGNQSYQAKKYAEAENKYKEGLNKNKDSYKAAFNLGDAYYKQEKYEEAAEQFQALTHKATSKDKLAQAYHNLGNSFLKSKKYQESIDAYKNALKNNPKDEETRYNLACAQQYLKQQQQQQKQDQDKKDDKKDKKDNKDKNKDEDKKDKKEDQKDNEEKKKEEQDKKDKQKQEQEKNKISKEDAQRLLDALQSDEKNLHEKLKKGKVKGVRVEIEKDW